MRAILMESPNNEGDSFSTATSCHQTNHLLPILACIQLVKGVPWKFPIKQSCCCTNWYNASQLLKTTLIKHIEHGETELVACIELSPLCSNVFGVGRFSVGFKKRNINTLHWVSLQTYSIFSILLFVYLFIYWDKFLNF